MSDATKCPACGQRTARYNTVANRWECPCSWHDKKPQTAASPIRWTRRCPHCSETITKDHALELWLCDGCGWSGA